MENSFAFVRRVSFFEKGVGVHDDDDAGWSGKIEIPTGGCFPLRLCAERVAFRAYYKVCCC